jgi:L-alanine-DL-glutamate epimerase-like enolase superfamily enzyme
MLRLPMIAGETQATCFEMARDFAACWKGREALEPEQRMQELHDLTAFNATIKSAFDMALHDLAAKAAGQPLYRYLGGKKKELETDLTIGIDTPEKMAHDRRPVQGRWRPHHQDQTGQERSAGCRTRAADPRCRRTRYHSFGSTPTRAGISNSANPPCSKWDPFHIQFCEQPMRTGMTIGCRSSVAPSPVKIMADESVFDHHDARRLIAANACDYVNIKFAKSGGILEATRINTTCEQQGIPCMMGGMLESRVALTAFAHFALAHDNIVFYDMDTCLLGHTADPVTGGVRYNGYFLDIPDTPGLGADADDAFLQECPKVTV